MTALPPGTCGIHGYHGRAQCPRCSTSTLPFTPLIHPTPILSQPEHLSAPGIRAERDALLDEVASLRADLRRKDAAYLLAASELDWLIGYLSETDEHAAEHARRARAALAVPMEGDE